jgi:hypothetical protein
VVVRTPTETMKSVIFGSFFHPRFGLVRALLSTCHCIPMHQQQIGRIPSVYLTPNVCHAGSHCLIRRSWVRRRWSKTSPFLVFLDTNAPTYDYDYDDYTLTAPLFGFNNSSHSFSNGRTKTTKPCVHLGDRRDCCCFLF